MALFQKFPWTDEHQLNLDWILRFLRSLHGGSPGSVLTKASNKDYDWTWQPGGGGGTSDYDSLSNRPQINGVTLTGNKTTLQLHINDIYIVTYGVTLSTEVESAYQAGKVVMCQYGSRWYILTQRTNSVAHRFSCIVQNVNYSLVLSNNTWSTTTSTMAVSSSVHSVPSGGSTGQVLTKNSNSNYDLSWTTPSGGGTPYTSNPAPLGTASPGSSDDYARGDHVHENIIYWATYGTTTSAELEAAYQAGKVVMCDYNSQIYILAVRTSATSHRFMGLKQDALPTLIVSNNNWTSGNRTVPLLTSTVPQPLGTASAGSGTECARSNHVHAMPSAADVGAIAAPASPTAGQVLMWDGSAWVAANLP